MRYDEYDAEVLGLLGEIYLQENEGDDIALRFCEKARWFRQNLIDTEMKLCCDKTWISRSVSMTCLLEIPAEWKVFGI